MKTEQNDEQVASADPAVSAASPVSIDAVRDSSFVASYLSVKTYTLPEVTQQQEERLTDQVADRDPSAHIHSINPQNEDGKIAAHRSEQDVGQKVSLKRSIQSNFATVSLEMGESTSHKVDWKHPYQSIIRILAGPEFANCMRAIQPFPLRYREPAAEERIRVTSKRVWFDRAMPACLTLAISTVCFSIALLAGGLSGQFMDLSTGDAIFITITLLVGIVVFSLCGFGKKLPVIGTWPEISFYILCTAYYALYTANGLIVLDDLPATPSDNSTDTIITPQLNWYMVFSAYSQFLVLSLALVVTTLLPTVSRYAIWFILALLITTIITEVVKAETIDKFSVSKYPASPALCLLTLVMWVVKWTYELGTRIRVIIMLTAVANVERTKQFLKRTRKGYKTPLEDLIEMLRSAIDTVEKVIEDEKINSPRRVPLIEAVGYLNQSVRELTSKSLFSVKLLAGENSEEKIQREMFLDLYKFDHDEEDDESRIMVRRHLGAKKESMPFLSRENMEMSKDEISRRKTMGPFGESSETVDGIKLPALKWPPNTGVGSDLDLDFSELWPLAESPISEVGWILLTPLVPFMCGSELNLRSFLFALDHLNWNNPYHNSAHAAFTAHFATAVLGTNGLDLYSGLELIDLVGLVVAALGHDVSHPGRNREFWIQSNSLLTSIYSDRSPLEMMSATIIRQLFRASEQTNLIKLFAPSEHRQCCKLITDLMISVDMAKHFEFLTALRVRQLSPDFNAVSNSSDLLLTLKLVFKVSDLAHVFVSWDTHLHWSLCMAEEHYQQGEDEVRLGMNVSPLCDRGQKDFTNSALTQLSLVITPMVDQLSAMDSYGALAKRLQERTAECIRRWTNLRDTKDPCTIPDHILEKRNAPVLFTYVVSRTVTMATDYSSLFRDFANVVPEIVTPHSLDKKAVPEFRRPFSAEDIPKMSDEKKDVQDKDKEREKTDVQDKEKIREEKVGEEKKKDVEPAAGLKRKDEIESKKYVDTDGDVEDSLDEG